MISIAVTFIVIICLFVPSNNKKETTPIPIPLANNSKIIHKRISIKTKATVILIILLFFLVIVSFAQQKSTNSFNYSGQILDADSVPVESAYLISYKTLMIYSTDAEGRFTIPVMEGDSFKIVHIAYQPYIIKPQKGLPENPVFLDFEEYAIEPVSINSNKNNIRNKDMDNFNRNMKIITKQLQQEGCFLIKDSLVKGFFIARTPANTLVNGIQMGGGGLGVTLNSNELYKHYQRMKRRLHRSRVKADK
jgi:hypothetical protein